ncbi:hypothetical protein GLYMA_04G192400v4 [Glycine max]|uniref:B3 domain-containing protein Os01g0905400-like isoform X3 n=1 Tax=Glycine soja TaxID=3848 RepID=UPI0007191760|nr:B3 domain-containing protein Os01g0905400-like isoform X3 [Glycine soja]KAG4392658.1 hypothetical protein GLYMA_04G192400v4 [Glycine max]KAH1112113.1 hypothetical protein GYH30_010446 [Glycine max]|eukprot:XP_014630297.1 B3 domain-containing protein Os01g0905400 isoform X3 [Glycine max]
MCGERQRVSACAACTNNCLLFHKTKQTSPTSFFKLITKREHLTTLYIPPAFSSTVSDLVNKKIALNDSSERQWNVKVSGFNGSFAFMEGWSTFSLNHGVKVGYLLVFNYVKDLHFDVKIYDPSACEKLNFPKTRNQKKRSRGRSGSPVRDCMLVGQESNALVVTQHYVPKMKSQRSEVDLVVRKNGEESGQLMCISELHEDPCYSTSLEFDQSHGVNGTMKIVNGDLKVSNVDYGSHIFENDAIVCSKDTMFEGIFSMAAALDISEFEMSGRSTSLGEADKSTHDKTSTLNIEENKESKAIMYSGEAQECQFSNVLESDQAAISKKEPALHIDGSCNTKNKFNEISNHLDTYIHNGEMKKLPVDKTPKLYSSVDKLNVTGLPKETKGKLDHYSDPFNQDNESHFKTAPPLMSNGEAQECQFSEGLESDQAAISKKEPALHICGFSDTKQNFDGISNDLDGHIYNGEMKKLPMDMTPKLCGSMDKLNITELPKEIKDSDISNQDDESHFKTAPPLSCVVTNDNDNVSLFVFTAEIARIPAFDSQGKTIHA